MYPCIKTQTETFFLKTTKQMTNKIQNFKPLSLRWLSQLNVFVNVEVLKVELITSAFLYVTGFLCDFNFYW